MAMVKQSSSRYEQKRISRLESEIRAAQKAGISANQIKQVVIETYRVKKHDTEQGNVTMFDADKWDGKVFDPEQKAVKVRKHLVLPSDSYEQFEGKRSQRLSRPMTKMFLDHPERLEQYNVLRNHRFSRFMAIDIITNSYSGKGYDKGGHEEIPPKKTQPLDLAANAWQKLMRDHKAMFTKTYDVRTSEKASAIYRLLTVFSGRWIENTKRPKAKLSLTRSIKSRSRRILPVKID